MFKKVILLSCFAASIYFGPFLHRQTKALLEEREPPNFSKAMLVQTFPEHLIKNADLPLPSTSISFQKPFHYIGHGNEAIAFSNEDGYVIKFFLLRDMHGKKKYPMPKPTHWIASHRKKRELKRKAKREETFHTTVQNYLNAHAILKEKTGLLGMYLRPPQNSLPTISVTDMNGKNHEIDLNQHPFLLQKKAHLVLERLQMANPIEKKKLLESLSQFFEERARLGFFDVEKSFMIEANYGFIDDKPVQLDVGSIEFSKDQKENPENEIKRMQSLLSNWAQERCDILK